MRAERNTFAGALLIGWSQRRISQAVRELLEALVQAAREMVEFITNSSVQQGSHTAVSQSDSMWAPCR